MLEDAHVCSHPQSATWGSSSVTTLWMSWQIAQMRCRHSSLSSYYQH